MEDYPGTNRVSTPTPKDSVVRTATDELRRTILRLEECLAIPDELAKDPEPMVQSKTDLLAVTLIRFSKRLQKCVDEAEKL